MKREGRQHGMVRTCPTMSGPSLNPRPKRRLINELASPPTAGLFSKVSTKPTSHSKFTGKCDRPMCRACHISPASKSKPKVKGAHKVKSSSDMVSDVRLVSWRVVDNNDNNCGGAGLKLKGFSATSVLDYLDYRGRSFYADGDVDYDDDDDDLEIGDQTYDVEDDVNGVLFGNSVEIEVLIDDGANDDDEDDDGMSFCEVGYVWEPFDDDEWCLVMEQM